MAADGWLLLACCLGVVVYVWFAVSIGTLGLPRLLLLCILFAACAIWHSGRVRRLNGYAAPDDLCVSRRRAALLIGGFAGIALLFGAAVIAAPFSGLLEFERGRYEIAVETGSFYSGQLLGLFLLLFAALGALAACCLRMTAQTRLYPALLIVVSALPGLGAAVLLYLRVSLIVSFSPPAFEQALITVEGDLNASMAQLLSTARTVWIAATVLVIALCVVLRLIRRRGAPLPLLLPLCSVAKPALVLDGHERCAVHPDLPIGSEYLRQRGDHYFHRRMVFRADGFRFDLGHLHPDLRPAPPAEAARRAGGAPGCLTGQKEGAERC